MSFGSAGVVGGKLKEWRWCGFQTVKSTSLNYIGTGLPLADGEVSCYRLDVPNIAEEVEIHLHDSSLTPSKRARKRAKRYYPSHSVRMARRRLLLGRYAFFGVAFSPCPILSISLK